ncbi:carbon-nitrogen hydrolase family protein [Celerinatantimonas sp. YJH-8]|uniref:carbon-nitrogen hydrolase family protein n=1 Tax=Celerinatantimonas sp. YJH-8 TaxID=3228714 RepID=UPI0038CBDF37
MNSAKNVKIAAIQMNSYSDIAYNIATAERLINEAVLQGASYVLLPEYFYWMGRNDADRLSFAEVFGDGLLQRHLSGWAKQYGVWISGGTIALKSLEPDRVFNTNLTFDPSGICVGRYDKIHLFGFDDGEQSYQESDVLYPGDQVQTIQTPFARIRPSVCYDLRFPELYRQRPDYELITAPAAFTYKTGLAHWHLLLQARAVENQCYVLAAGQTGEHDGGKRTFGHSVIIDPWGEIVAERQEGDGIVIAELDKTRLATVRRQLPALAHRVLSV